MVFTDLGKTTTVGIDIVEEVIHILHSCLEIHNTEFIGESGIGVEI